MNAATETKTDLPPLKQGDRLYGVNWESGDLYIMIFVREEIAPGASLPTYILKDENHRRSQCSTDMYHRTPKEAYAKYIADIEFCLPDLKQQIGLAIAKERRARALLKKVKALHKAEK